MLDMSAPGPDPGREGKQSGELQAALRCIPLARAAKTLDEK